ncbi:MAG: endonuclease [Myxococcales bacterium]|nr:endonuclease [Myxococcales bacterium]
MDDDALVAALHRELHEAYRPIEVQPDLGGNPNRYTTARFLMFTQVEYVPGPDGQLGQECVYTGRFAVTPEGEEPARDAINCEHTWPRSRMAAEDTLRYSHEQSDIHHLLPTDPNVNSARGSLPFGDVMSVQNGSFRPALIGDDGAGHLVFEPRDERKGDVARVIFYFATRWGTGLAAYEEAPLRRWMVDDPVDARERRRNDLIEAIQGNRNPYIDCPELVGRIADFAEFEPLDTEQSLPAP